MPELIECRVCGKSLTAGTFPKSELERRPGRKPRCKACGRIAKKQSRTRLRKKFFKWLKRQSCSVCGENDLRVLELHHHDQDEKEYTVSRMLSWGRPWSLIETEIAKCQVLCANCHRKQHVEIRDGMRVTT